MFIQVSAEHGIAAATDDATHQLTAGAMHAKKVLRPAIAAHHTAHPHEHHHITHRGGGYGMAGDRPACRARDMFSQSGSLPGEWVPHADAAWAGDYEHGECPHFAKDFDCTTGSGETYHRNKELAKTEFNKVFQPHKCALAAHPQMLDEWQCWMSAADKEAIMQNGEMLSC